MLDELKKALKDEMRVQITIWDPNQESVEHVFNSYIMEHAGLMIRIAPPHENGKTIIPLMQQGFVVGVVLETYPAPFIFYPVIRDQVTNPSDGYWLVIPENTDIEVFQRRRHFRIPMMVPFEVEYLQGLRGDTVTAQARTCDVSGGGMRFTSSHSFAKGQEITVYLQFDEEQPMMRLKALVVFTGENRIRKFKDDVYVAACQFVGLEAAEEMLLVRECFRRELRQKQKHL